MRPCARPPGGTGNSWVSERLRFERFDKSKHDRGNFDCGVAALNDYLRTRLGQHSRKSLTRGYVLATPKGRIAGYFTLAAGRLMVNVIPQGHGFPARSRCRPRCSDDWPWISPSGAGVWAAHSWSMQ